MIYIDKKSKTTIYEQIYSHYVKEILSGDMKAGDMLPATRKLAYELSIGRNTVEKAYQQLLAEGYISSRQGSGYSVNNISLDDFSLTTKPLPDIPFPEKEKPPKYNFVYGSMDNSVFPYAKWQKCINEVLASSELSDSLEYPDKIGEYKLRYEICRYLHRSRGVTCTPDQVIITCGQQYSMEMLANMFENTKKRFAMEDPGYDGIRQVFINRNFDMKYIPVDENGISMNSVSNLKTDLLYVTPSHQFPSGGVLPIGRRLELLKWANRTDTYLIEDDYDSELRYYTNPIPAMQSLDEHQRTIYTGTFSKSFAPFMRLSYMVLPQSLIDSFFAYYHRYHCQVTTMHQLALAEFIADGSYERHVNKLRTLYKKKLTALLSAVTKVFGEKVKVAGGGAGIHLLITVNSPLSQKELLARAEEKEIRLYSTDALYMNKALQPKNQLLLGFPTIPQSDFEKIMVTLKNVWELT